MIDPTVVIELRHLLHRYAEGSGREVRTAGLVRKIVAMTRPDRLVSELGGHGLLAEYRGAEPGPSILLRAELDALPIPDPAGWDHASLTEGTAHKCGHDGHMAILLRVAEELGHRRPERGSVLLLFQPAEETGEGARKVLDDPHLGDLTPSWVFALHNLPGFPRGQVVVRPGPFAMASRGLGVHLAGETAHAATPDEGRRPTNALVELVRLLDDPPGAPGPGGSGRMTVVHAQLGEPGAFGTTPGIARLDATLRAPSDDDLDQMAEEQLRRIREIAARHELAATVSWHEPFPATWNDPRAAELVRSAARQEGLAVVEPDGPFGWSEDFGHFTAATPGALFGLGAGTEHARLHTSQYDFPDDLIEPGVRLLLRLCDTALNAAPRDAPP